MKTTIGILAVLLMATVSAATFTFAPQEWTVGHQHNVFPFDYYGTNVSAIYTEGRELQVYRPTHSGCNVIDAARLKTFTTALTSRQVIMGEDPYVTIGRITTNANAYGQIPNINTAPIVNSRLLQLSEMSWQTTDVTADVIAARTAHTTLNLLLSRTNATYNYPMERYFPQALGLIGIQDFYGIVDGQYSTANILTIRDATRKPTLEVDCH
jgi:hypothetical protein